MATRNVSFVTSVLICAALLFWIGCANAIQRGTLERAGQRQPVMVSKGCRAEEFSVSGSEHMIEEIKENFVVRKVRGRIVSDSGEWPPEGVLFELQKLDQKEVKSTHSDTDGAFSMPGVEAGTYCFKASIDGWQSVMGIVVVDEGAAKAATIDFEMLLGV